ncbi:hypothetical protein DV714_04745 [Parageobacillus thermoglucosidasius]|nr:hypothetical protein DV714_04745 [Parageobacillus thermoglucosidasius]
MFFQKKRLCVRSSLVPASASRGKEVGNTEVKLSSADGSWGQRPCESRSSLGRQKIRELASSLIFLPSL